jgi:glycosyltransferase involved in cell wall biosynthesis
VRSLLSQSEPVEIVVVNSCGGDPEDALRSAGLDVPVIDSPRPLFPGAARNLAIEATSAPYVAFLAADCRAEPGWAAGRLRRHRAGAQAVACAMANTTPDRRSSCAAYLLLHNRRMPETPAGERLLYGLSYARPLLERLGGFRGDLRAGEDSKLNSLLPEAAAWAPDVVCAHRYPTRPGEMLRDQYSRGRRRAAMRRITGEKFTWRIPRSALRNIRRSIEQARLASDPVERRRLLRARALVYAGGAAYAVGAALQRWPAFHRPDDEYQLDPAEIGASTVRRRRARLRTSAVAADQPPA